MIWAKTDAGRAEMQTRALVKDRALRNLLLTIDGKTPAERLLAGMPSISAADFESLQQLGLIAPLAAPAPVAAAPAPPVEGGRVDIDVSALDYATFRGVIGRMISKELGMRGLTMSMILEEALDVEDLVGVAHRLVKQIGERKGDAAAAAARKALFGK